MMVMVMMMTVMTMMTYKSRYSAAEPYAAAIISLDVVLAGSVQLQKVIIAVF